MNNVFYTLLLVSVLLFTNCKKIESSIVDLICLGVPTEQVNLSENNELIKKDRLFTSDENVHYFLTLEANKIPDNSLFYTGFNIETRELVPEYYTIVVEEENTPLITNQNNAADTDWEIGKIDQDGNRLWVNKINFEPHGIVSFADNDENIMLLGYGWSDTPTWPEVQGNLALFSQDGELKGELLMATGTWVREVYLDPTTGYLYGFGQAKIGGDNFPCFFEISLDANGEVEIVAQNVLHEYSGYRFVNGVYVGGSSTLFAAILESIDSKERFLLSFDFSFSEEWRQSLGENESDYFNSIPKTVLIWDHNYFYTLSNQIGDELYEFGQSGTSIYGPNGLVQAFNGNGIKIWEQKLMGGLPERYDDLLLIDESLYVAGQHSFYCSCDLVCYSNAIIAKIDKNSGEVSSYKTFSKSSSNTDFSFFRNLATIDNNLFSVGGINASFFYGGDNSQGWFVRLDLSDF